MTQADALEHSSRREKKKKQHQQQQHECQEESAPVPKAEREKTGFASLAHSATKQCR